MNDIKLSFGQIEKMKHAIGLGYENMKKSDIALIVTGILFLSRIMIGKNWFPSGMPRNENLKLKNK